MPCTGAAWNGSQLGRHRPVLELRVSKSGSCRLLERRDAGSLARPQSLRVALPAGVRSRKNWVSFLCRTAAGNQGSEAEKRETLIPPCPLSGTRSPLRRFVRFALGGG